MRQVVIIEVPTCYEDPEEARKAVQPYIDDMRIVASIIDVRPEKHVVGETNGN